MYNDGDPNDPRKAAEAKRRLDVKRSGHEGDCLYLQCETSKAQLPMACVMLHTGDAALRSTCNVTPNCNTVTMNGLCGQGQASSFVKWCVYTDCRRHEAPLSEALELARAAAALPIEHWYARQQEALRARWEASRITIEGLPALQTGLDFAIYTLMQSAGQDGIASIASKGLSGEGYEGHFFWDTEIYMFPFFLLTQPTIARALLDFRYATLAGAREQARLLGHARGALYPWRTITGSECSAYFPSGSAQYHINSDIAHAVITYYFVTGDQAYLKQKGMEMLIETARLWLDVGHWHEGRFYINGVTGPDEYTCLVNNNYYTNLSAQFHLRHTLQICRELEQADPTFSAQERFGFTQEERHAFEQAADGMYLPYAEGLGIYAQDDSFLQKERMDLAALPAGTLPLLLSMHPLAFYRRQVCKQADAVLAHFLYETGIPEEIIRRTYAYYEPITTHDSSLSPCVFSMMAARIGEPEKAYTYYMRTANMDLDNIQGNTGDGIHAANMGGVYMGVVYGFAGLRLQAQGLTLRPCIPHALSSYAFPLRYRGHTVHVQVDHTRIALWLQGAGSMEVTVYETPCTVTEARLEIPLSEVSRY